MPRTLVFDVNETLLDLGVLAPHFERIYGSADTLTRWFLELQRLWLVDTATDHYHDFPTLIGHALHSVADGHEVSDADVDAVLDAVVQLPAHADVPPALDRLKAAGFRLAALTNGTLGAVHKQLDHAGIADRFDMVMSADEVGRYKPAPEPYRFAAERLGQDLGALTLVAAHAWDIAGAYGVGMRTAFVARPGKTLVPGWPAPDLQGPDLGAVADILVGSADA